MVAGSMGDITKSFDFIVSCDRKWRRETVIPSRKAAGSKVQPEARWQHSVEGSKNSGSTLTIYESNADGYEMTFTVGTDPKELSGRFLYHSAECFKNRLI